MELSAFEILLLSVLFVIPQALFFLMTYVAYYLVAVKRGLPKLKPFHVVDILMPFLAAVLWAAFQSKSQSNKSFGNLVEVSYMGVFWGLLFIYRCWRVICMRPYRIGILVAVECVVAIVLTVFMPTLSE